MIKNINYLISIYIYDKEGEKLDGAYKKAELVPQEDISDKRGNKLDVSYKKIIGDSPKGPIYDKNGIKLDNNYRKVISDKRRIIL